MLSQFYVNSVTQRKNKAKLFYAIILNVEKFTQDALYVIFLSKTYTYGVKHAIMVDISIICLNG